jgi:hypothetical protein
MQYKRQASDFDGIPAKRKAVATAIIGHSFSN